MMIFHNEKKGNICDLNLDGIRKSFGHFIQPEEHRVNLNVIGSGKYFQEAHLEAFKIFRTSLQVALQSLPIVGIELESTWIKVRKEIEKLSRTNAHIPVEKLWKICNENKISSGQDKKDLSQLFHDLGVFLHFQDEEAPSLLSKIVILQNDWATKAVYMILKSEKLREEKRGHFTLSDLQKIWENTDYYHHAPELLELMMKFELCYRVGTSKVYIAPQLLPASPPTDYSFDGEEFSLLRYNYDFMPKGMITRLTVRLHPYIANNQKLAWKDGFVVEINGAKAEIIETYGKREIHIKAVGEYRRKLINQIAFSVDELNKTYHFSERIQAFKLIPCNCMLCINDEEPHFYKYRELQNQRKEGWSQVPCGKTGKPAKVEGLLSYVLEGNDKERIKWTEVSSKLDGIAMEQKNISSALKIISKEITDNNELLKSLDARRVDEEKLKFYTDEIKQKLEGIASKVPQLKATSSYQELKNAPAMDIKGKFKFTWTLLPAILEQILPFMPNVKYEKEITADLKAWTNQIIQDFKKGIIFREPGNPLLNK